MEFTDASARIQSRAGKVGLALTTQHLPSPLRTRQDRLPLHKNSVPVSQGTDPLKGSINYSFLEFNHSTT